ncbi:2,3-bisphosphoglycerate-independent phosphoglycerate mutase [Nematocida ausubeli]|uniref:phosphoglycerate mutase (2,3-diphosphoglycerate-independent) n=1 Tax=Nematocida ausubeli (strain ATCC PRA-371 / ERTm2) TaxID=1913371 RepID=H8ZA98_NEMA1|nr:2,3-bisphosphoglycerate-independent phosphoglycerate mutase [Nematocida ausubeli]
MQKIKINEKKCCLVVLDGWGYNEEINPEIKDGIILGKPKYMESLCKTYYSALLYAHGRYVGLLSDESMGNSEVGHLTIGSGRIVQQDSVRIRQTLSSDPLSLAEKLFLGGTRLPQIHILGILSDGGIHGHWMDIRDMAILVADFCDFVYIHTISDGRDTRPSEYLKYLDLLMESVPENVLVVSVSGRFYSMDRDRREERTEEALSAITNRKNEVPEKMKTESLTRRECLENIKRHVNSSYSSGITDEFIVPFCSSHGIQDGDTVVLTNFRIDRIKQIYNRLNGYGNVYTMTRVCNEQKTEKVLFERPSVNNALGDVIESLGLQQTRIAESEKQAHVTFFFDGGKDVCREHEKRIIHQSQKVDTFDAAPEMMAAAVAESVCSSIASGDDFILANLANCDMVGHTGSLEATMDAVKFVDNEVYRIYCAAKEHGYNLVITADHGNAEIMKDAKGTVKSHTTNRVPVIIIRSTDYKDELSQGNGQFDFVPTKDRALCDVAPTILDLMQQNIPKEMTGTSLLPKCTME